MSDINELLDNLREDFLDDMPARIQKIEAEVMSSEKENDYDELFRLVHSLKGTAGSYDFHVITKIAHGMEDVMISLMTSGHFGSKQTIETLLKFIDILRDTTESLIETKTVLLDIDERLDDLRSEVFNDGLKILVVEPSKLYADLIKYSLNDLVVNLTFKDDGLPALNNLLLNQYDLLITSLECPHLNGDALTAALRLLHNFNKNIKVILLTSRVPDNIINKDYFDAILDRKMIKNGELSKTVALLLDN